MLLSVFSAKLSTCVCSFYLNLNIDIGTECHCALSIYRQYVKYILLNVLE